MSRPRPSWHERGGRRTASEALDRMDAHRVIVSIYGLAQVVRDITTTLPESVDKTDLVYVCDRLEEITPQLVTEFNRLGATPVRVRGNLTSGTRPEFEKGTGKVRR